MEHILFRYCSRQLTAQDIFVIQAIVRSHYAHGRTHISQIVCTTWQWVQPNGEPKQYGARDLLLRLEEKGFIELPSRIRRNNRDRGRPHDLRPPTPPCIRVRTRRFM